MISVEGTWLANVARIAMQSSLLNAAINPGSPVFARTAHYLQEALAILANIDPLAPAAAVAGLGVLVAYIRLRLL